MNDTTTPAANFDWNKAKAFLATAQHGSLSAAARILGTTQPTLGRQVSALEQELQVVLFERIGQGLVLTPSGQELLKQVEAMAEAANQVSLIASGQSQQLEGCVSISASEVHAYFWLPPIIAELRRLEPKIEIEIIATNNVSDLRRREADIALRNFRPTELELITKKVKDAHARLYATKEYLASLTEDQRFGDLSETSFVGFDQSGMLIKGLNALGLNLSRENFPIQTESYLTHWQLVKQGLGIGVMPEDIADAEDLVEQVNPQLAAIEFPVWLTTHRELHTSRRVRKVFDFLAQHLSI
jgi:DNA-binding transcriptional LysR family regulator